MTRRSEAPSRGSPYTRDMARELPMFTPNSGHGHHAAAAELSIAIRTAVAARGELQLHLGGGIVADSDPQRELAETRDKGRGFARSWGVEV